MLYQKCFRWTAATIVAVSFSSSVSCLQSQEFRPVTVVRRSFPAIKDAKFVSAEEAAQELLPEELVLGVTIKGTARAYPINMLKGPRREIINDTLNGVAFAATW